MKIISSIILALLFSAQVSISQTGEAEKYTADGVRFSPSIHAIPLRDANEILIPGWTERAETNEYIAKIIYGPNTAERRDLFKKVPYLQEFLKHHAGFWSELVGKVPVETFVRWFGPDIVLAREKGSKKPFRYQVLESNGPNIAGPERLMRISQEFAKHPELGEVPFNDDFYARVISHLKRISKKAAPQKTQPLIVFADEASVSSEEVLIDGKRVKPPFAVGKKLTDALRSEFAKYGVEWISLVDDRGRVFSKDNKLYLKYDSGKVSQIDVIFMGADPESTDPLNVHQTKRNLNVGRPDLNLMAKLIGIPGLVSAWMSGSFVWANNPMSNLTSSKIMPLVVDDVIRWRKGREPIVPAAETNVFFDLKTGKVDSQKLQQHLDNAKNEIYKASLGQGGKQIELPDEMSDKEIELFRKTTKKQILTNPFLKISQPLLEFDTIELDYRGKLPKADYQYDIRMFGLIGDGQTLSRQIMSRFAAKDVRVLNITQGLGGVAILVADNVAKAKALPPLVRAGTAMVPFGYRLSDEQNSDVLQDSRERALVEASLIRDIYTDPKELFAQFPLLEKFIKSNAFYSPSFRNSLPKNHVSYFYSGPDYIVQNDGKISVIEQNTTQIGGFFRQWLRGEEGIEEEFRRWLKEIEDQDPGFDGKKLLVYYMEESDLGQDWKTVRKKFFDTFGVVITTRTERSLFHIENGVVLFRETERSKKWQRVTSMVLHVEPDFLDQHMVGDNDLSLAADAQNQAELRSHELLGIYNAITSGNLLVVNLPGDNVACSKCLLPFMPALREYYLGKSEIIPTQTSFAFIDKMGALNTTLLADMKRTPKNYIVKEGQDIGGSEKVHFFWKLSKNEQEDMIRKITEAPYEFMVQLTGDLAVDKLGRRAELRGTNLVKIDGQNGKVQIVGTMPKHYGRFSNAGATAANIIPKKHGAGVSLADSTAAFNSPIIRESDIVFTPQSPNKCLSAIRREQQK